MPSAPEFDLERAHRHFAPHCFNTAWDFLEKQARTPEDDEELVALGHASLWHWLQRADRQPKNLCVAYWMLARIYSTLGRAGPAQHYARLCQEQAERASLSPFLQGCAEEALARAARAAGDVALFEQHYALAQAIAGTLEGDDQKVLLNDLGSIPRLQRSGD